MGFGRKFLVIEVRGVDAAVVDWVEAAIVVETHRLTEYNWISRQKA